MYFASQTRFQPGATRMTPCVSDPFFDYWGRTLYCNSFQLVIGTQRAVMIDTGYAYGDLLTLARAHTDSPVDLLITHSDLDHRRGAPST